MKKSDREIMEILEAFDATECPHSAAQLAGADPKTVRRYVAARDAGVPVIGPGRRPRIIDVHLPKIEEWVERSEGKARADVIHARLVGLGFTGTERTTRRAVAAVKAACTPGRSGAPPDCEALVMTVTNSAVPAAPPTCCSVVRMALPCE